VIAVIFKEHGVVETILDIRTVQEHFKEILGVCQRHICHICFVGRKKLYARVRHVGMLLEYGVEGSLLLAPNIFIPALNLLSVSEKSRVNRSPWVLDFDKDVCCHHYWSI